MRRATLLFAALLAVAAHPAAAAGCRLALDIGHTRAHPGVTSAHGITEWTYNRALAERVEAAVEADGIAVTLINPDGGPITLPERTRIAARAGADLFLALHHDSVQDRYLSDWTWKGKVYKHSEAFSGFGVFVSAKNPAFDESRRVGADIADGLLAHGLRPSLHHAEPIPGENRPLLDPARGLYRFDDLIVLKTATMPAVLLEAGVVVNRDDEPVIATDAYRDKVAQSVAGAVSAFCRRLK